MKGAVPRDSLPVQFFPEKERALGLDRSNAREKRVLSLPSRSRLLAKNTSSRTTLSGWLLSDEWASAVRSVTERFCASGCPGWWRHPIATQLVSVVNTSI